MFMSDYTIPDFLKDELSYGDLSVKIDDILGKYDFKSQPLLKELTIEEITNNIKAYIGLLYLSQESEIKQLVFLRMLKSDEFDVGLKPVINNYISIYKSSLINDSNIIQAMNDSVASYFSLVRNCICPQFIEISKSMNKKYRSQVEKFVVRHKIRIDIDILTTLTKCAIIQCSRDSRYQMRFSHVDDAIDYALKLYLDKNMTYEDKKKEILHNKELIDIISHMADFNGFSR